MAGAVSSQNQWRDEIGDMIARREWRSAIGLAEGILAPSEGDGADKVDDRCFAYAHLAKIYKITRNFEEAERVSREYLAYAKEIQRPQSVLSAYDYLTFALLRQEKWEELGNEAINYISAHHGAPPQYREPRDLQLAHSLLSQACSHLQTPELLPVFVGLGAKQWEMASKAKNIEEQDFALSQWQLALKKNNQWTKLAEVAQIQCQLALYNFATLVSSKDDSAPTSPLEKARTNWRSALMLRYKKSPAADAEVIDSSHLLDKNASDGKALNFHEAAFITDSRCLAFAKETGDVDTLRWAYSRVFGVVWELAREQDTPEMARKYWLEAEKIAHEYWLFASTNHSDQHNLLGVAARAANARLCAINNQDNPDRESDFAAFREEYRQFLIHHRDASELRATGSPPVWMHSRFAQRLDNEGTHAVDHPRTV